MHSAISLSSKRYLRLSKRCSSKDRVSAETCSERHPAVEAASNKRCGTWHEKHLQWLFRSQLSIRGKRYGTRRTTIQERCGGCTIHMRAGIEVGTCSACSPTRRHRKSSRSIRWTPGKSQRPVDDGYRHFVDLAYYTQPAPPPGEPAHRRAARYAWALLLARICEVFPLRSVSNNRRKLASGKTHYR